jgi:hypothetical protein
MVMSSVGYPEPGEPGSMDVDRFNKTPKFCTKCKRTLKSFDGETEYDAFTGNPIHTGTLICPSLSGLHDRWELAKYGAWINYRQR